MPPLRLKTLLKVLSKLRKGKKHLRPPLVRGKRNKRPGRVYKTDDRYETALLRDDARVERYHHRNQRNYVPRLPWVMVNREKRWDHCHRATNCHGRIIFNRAYQRTLAEHVPADTSVFFATISSRAYILPLEVADTIDLKSLQAFCRQAVGNATGIGLVEAALYIDCDAYGPCRGSRVVSWHAHLLLWNTTAAALDHARSKIVRHVTMTGQNPVWFRELRRDEIAIMARYMGKPPRTEYRRRWLEGQSTDPLTGEVLQRQRQSKREIRTGNLVRIANVMRDTFTDQLLFGSGDGTALARTLALEITAQRDREEKALDEAKARANMTLEERLGLIPPHHRGPKGR